MFSKVINRFREKPAQWQWGIMAITIPTIFVVILLYYRQKNQLDADFGFLRNALLYSIIFPILLGMMFYIFNARSEISRLDYLQGLQQDLRKDILHSQEWANVVTILYKFIIPFIPIRGLSLGLYDKSSGSFRIVGNHGDSGTHLADESCLLANDHLRKNQEDNYSKDASCRRRDFASTVQINRDCFLLATENMPIGLLHLHLPIGYSLKSSQVDFINKMAPEVAYIVDYIQLKNRILESGSALRSEQDRIARHLHDTLAHNLAYLRLKLDQLVEDRELRGTTDMYQEVERLRNIADESYEQVRSSLMELRGDSPTDLASAVHDCAYAIGERAKFKVQVSSRGEPLDLSPHIQRQILYLFREILRNVEKHARARKVSVILGWTNNNLTISCCDDGQGFDISTAGRLNGHYGLKMIREIVDELNGEIVASSSANDGTEITLRIPLNQDQKIEEF